MPVKDGWWSTNSPSDLPKYIRNDLFSYKPTSFLDNISLNVS